MKNSNNKNRSNYPDLCKQIRAIHGNISMPQMAKKVGVSYWVWYGWEHGIRLPKGDMAWKLFELAGKLKAA